MSINQLAIDLVVCQGIFIVVFLKIFSYLTPAWEKADTLSKEIILYTSSYIFAVICVYLREYTLHQRRANHSSVPPPQFCDIYARGLFSYIYVMIMMTLLFVEFIMEKIGLLRRVRRAPV